MRVEPTIVIASVLGALAALAACATVAVPVGDAVAGARVYAECAGCHGTNAQGTVNGQVPALAGQHASVIAKQLGDYREGERWDARMESIMAEHRFADDAQIANVAAYLSGLPATPAGGGSGEGGERGAGVYGKACASCHGARGEGNGARVIPRLAGQQYMYLRRQLHDAVDGRRPNFPPDHVALLSPLEADDIDGLAEYLAELSP
ncbi:MAG: Cytochrome c-552 [Steroidobacteraceae bacterium]|nr:Cytochrome c-552 [Steroidobacteraceae bacterium]